jgi:hypothetical protein
MLLCRRNLPEISKGSRAQITRWETNASGPLLAVHAITNGRRGHNKHENNMYTLHSKNGAPSPEPSTQSLGESIIPHCQRTSLTHLRVDREYTVHLSVADENGDEHFAAVRD